MNGALTEMKIVRRTACSKTTPAGGLSTSRIDAASSYDASHNFDATVVAYRNK